VRSLARPSAGYGSYRKGADEIPARVSVTRTPTLWEEAVDYAIAWGAVHME